jgi:hypothetical protein
VRLGSRWLLVEEMVKSNHGVLERLANELSKKPALILTTLSIDVFDCHSLSQREVRDKDLGGPFPTSLQPLVGQTLGQIGIWDLLRRTEVQGDMAHLLATPDNLKSRHETAGRSLRDSECDCELDRGWNNSKIV